MSSTKNLVVRFKKIGDGCWIASIIYTKRMILKQFGETRLTPSIIRNVMASKLNYRLIIV